MLYTLLVFTRPVASHSTPSMIKIPPSQNPPPSATASVSHRSRHRSQSPLNTDPPRLTLSLRSGDLSISDRHRRPRRPAQLHCLRRRSRRPVINVWRYGALPRDQACRHSSVDNSVEARLVNACCDCFHCLLPYKIAQWEETLVLRSHDPEHVAETAAVIIGSRAGHRPSIGLACSLCHLLLYRKVLS